MILFRLLRQTQNLAKGLFRCLPRGHFLRQAVEWRSASIRHGSASISRTPQAQIGSCALRADLVLRPTLLIRRLQIFVCIWSRSTILHANLWTMRSRTTQCRLPLLKTAAIWLSTTCWIVIRLRTLWRRLWSGLSTRSKAFPLSKLHRSKLWRRQLTGSSPVVHVQLWFLRSMTKWLPQQSNFDRLSNPSQDVSR